MNALAVGLPLGAALLFLSGCALRPPDIPDRSAMLRTASPARSASLNDSALPNRLPVLPASLEQAVEIALLNNPELKAEYARIQALALDVPQVSSLDDPMFMVLQQEPFRGPEGERENMATLTQTFPWFGKRALRGRIAQTETLEAVEEYRSAALDMRREVSLVWHGLLFELESRRLLNEERTLLAANEDATLALYRAGQRDRGGMLRAQTESAMLGSDMLENEAEIIRQRRELERLLGAELAGEWTPAVEGDQPLEPLPLGVENLISIALENRPELAAYRQAQDRAKLQEELARSDFYPDLTLGAGYAAMGMNTGGYYDADSDERTDNWQASLSLNIPLPNARRRAAVAQAQHRAEEAEQRELAGALEIVKTIQATLAMLEALRSQHGVYVVSIIPLADEAHHASEAAYRSGQNSYVDLLDAQRALLGARRDLLRFTRDYHRTMTELERAIGLPLSLISHGEALPSDSEESQQ